MEIFQKYYSLPHAFIVVKVYLDFLFHHKNLRNIIIELNLYLESFVEFIKVKVLLNWFEDYKRAKI